MKYLLLLFLVYFLLGCQCKNFLEPFSVKKPIICPNVYVDLYNRKRFRVGVDIPGNPHDTIQLPNDSVIHVLGIDFDGDSIIAVQKGTEFFYAQNKYKVHEILTKPMWIDGVLTNISKGMYLQLLEIPKHCKCQNKRLKKFDKKIANIDIDSLLYN